MPDYVTQRGNPENQKRVAVARIELPPDLLRRGFHFVDTPGLGSSILANTRTTEAFLPRADAFMVVTSSGYTLVGSDRYACADHVNRGTCTNIRTVSRKAIERRVLSGIKDKFLTPDLIAVFVREFTEEWNRQTASSHKDRANREAELADVNRRIAQVMEAIEQGIVTTTTKSRLLELEAKREGLTVEVAKATPASAPPALHPNLAEVYRRKVADLETALDDPSIRGEAAVALRGLVDRVVLHPGGKRGEVRAELHGALAALMQLGSAKGKPAHLGMYGSRWLRG